MASHRKNCGALVCPPYSKCGSAGNCVCANCSHDGKMVCGSDGKTYNDFCDLQKVACNGNITLNMSRKGPCQGRFLLLYWLLVCIVVLFEEMEWQRTRQMQSWLRESWNKVSPEWFVVVSVFAMQEDLVISILVFIELGVAHAHAHLSVYFSQSQTDHFSNNI